MTASSRRRQGLTLVEVLISLVVITVVFVALAATQALTARMTRTSQQSSRATELAVEHLGRQSVTVLESFDDYVLNCTTSGSASYCQGNQALGDNYQVNWQAVRSDEPEMSGLIRIDVSVTGPASANMSTFVSCMDFTYADGAVPVDGNGNPTETKSPTIQKPGVCAP